MKRAIVIGCPGSGKSTFARKLRDVSGLPLFYMDRMFWNNDGSCVDEETLNQRLDDVLKQESWIVDGNFLRTMSKRLQYCDTVFYLDLPLEVCLDSIKQRIGKEREDLPWIETEGQNHDEFIDYVRQFNQDKQSAILNLLKQNSDKKIIIFKTREQVDDYIIHFKEE